MWIIRIIFANSIEKPKVLVCPKCVEISLYIENVDSFTGCHHPQGEERCGSGSGTLCAIAYYF